MAPDRLPAFSPDGRWFVYQQSLERTGDIRAADRGRITKKIVEGGTAPLWSADGKALYFPGRRGSLMEIATNGGATKQVPGEGFATPLDWWTRGYSIAPDG